MALEKYRVDVQQRIGVSPRQKVAFDLGIDERLRLQSITGWLITLKHNLLMSTVSNKNESNNGVSGSVDNGEGVSRRWGSHG